MAYIRRSGTGWRAEIVKSGLRTSSTFSTKAEAQAWAISAEADIIAGKCGEIPNKTFFDLLDRYSAEVSITKKGERWERVRIGALKRDALAQFKLAELSPICFANWRDRRLKIVSAGSVRREWVLLSAACSVALKEWKWLREHPMRGVKMPASPPPRDRLATVEEIELLKIALGYTEHRAISIGQRVGAAMMFALETGMRAGEICNLTESDIDCENRVARVRDGKTQAAKRDVPLSLEAICILNQLDNVLFNLIPTQIDANFRKAKKAAGIDGLHFHDLRANALTNLSNKLDILALARMIGHRDLKMLQIYYRESAAEMAKKL